MGDSSNNETLSKTNNETLSKAWNANYINNHGDSMFYSCGGASYVSGFESIHSNWYEDRRWKVKCCSGTGTCLTECDFTGYINGWEEDMDYRVPNGHVIKTVKSEHSSWYEDRRWKFESCRLVRC